MSFNNNFRDKKLADALLLKIREESKIPVRLMEVCGGHTMAIRKNGINSLLPSYIELLSGPGCPVCVTDQAYIDTLICYARQPDKIIVTYGDLIKVPGSNTSLDKEKASGADIRIIYSTSEALEIAFKNPEKKIIFAAIGFETTTPASAIAVLQAKKENLKNFFILCAHKVMPPVMSALIQKGIPIDGYIGPGHVCAITGSKLFEPVAEKHKIPIVISGFEPLDLLESILILIRMINSKNFGVEIQYRRLVSIQGNIRAQHMVDEVFEITSCHWRGIGPIPYSGLKLKMKFCDFDALFQFPVQINQSDEPKDCLCGLILKGLRKPADCKLFGTKCTPEFPIGACMVSSEGACNANYSFGI